MWTVDSGATNHVARDREAFVEYRRIPSQSRWIYVGNNSKAEVKGIGTCKLVMRGGRILLLHDVLYAPEIRRNLISINVLLSLGYVLIFKDNGLDIFLNSVLVGTGYMLDGFIVLDTNVDSCVNESCFSYVTSASNANIDVNI